jgi:hypothetical protein
MWHWIKRWRDLAMRDLFWPFQRSSGPEVRGIHFSYEKAGVTVRNEPIPWNADSILVEALVQFPLTAPRRKTDFHLRAPGHPQLTAITMHRHEERDLFRLQFRLPLLRQTSTVELFWKSTPLSQAVLPFLPLERFLDNLRIQAPTVFVRLGEYTVSCQAFLASQCRGLIASGFITSPTSLLPLIDLDFAVEFGEQRTGELQRIPVRLSSAQLASQQALVSVAAKRRPRRIGGWFIAWSLGGRTLARNEIRVVSQRTFRRSLYLADSRYVFQEKNAKPIVTRHLPAMNEYSRLGPCFLLRSREPGMAAICPLEVRAQMKTSTASPSLLDQEVLVTDGPSLFMPGTLSMADLQEVVAFELRCRGQTFGLLSTCPAPVANFTSEGGYKPPDDYAWTSSAEEELSDRLGRLLELPAD